MATEFSWQEIAPRIAADSTLDAIVYADRSGTIQLWNEAAVSMFGHTAEEAIGQSLDIIIPEKHRAAHWRGWERVMGTGSTRYGRDPLSAPGIASDGSTVGLEFSIIMLKDSEGEIEGIAAILRDVSKRWAKEKKLREELRELKKGQA